MENDDYRTVRVCTKKYSVEDDDGNIAEMESKQKQICLKEDDPFEDNDLVKVMSKEVYEQLISDVSYDDVLAQKDREISELQGQIDTLKSSFFDEVDDLKNHLSDKNDLIKAMDEINELNKKLVSVDEERVAIFKELDYKNKMILAYNVELNKSILNAINVVIDEARDNINKRNAQLIENLEKSIAKTKHEINEKNRAIAYDINSTVADMNQQIKDTSTIKMILNKHKINLRVPTDDLLKPFDFDFNAEQLLSGQTLELDASDILKEVMPKLPEPFSKYIDTLEEEPETIDINAAKDE